MDGRRRPRLDRQGQDTVWAGASDTQLDWTWPALSSVISHASPVILRHSSSVIRHPPSSVIRHLLFVFCHPSFSVIRHPLLFVILCHLSSFVILPHHPSSDILCHLSSSVICHPLSSVIRRPSSFIHHQSSVIFRHPSSFVIHNPPSSSVIHYSSSVIRVCHLSQTHIFYHSRGVPTDIHDTAWGSDYFSSQTYSQGPQLTFEMFRFCWTFWKVAEIMLNGK